MSFLIERRVAVVTGGSSGIGLEAVRLLLAQGARVAFCGRNRERLAAAEAELRAAYPEAELLSQACDVLDEASCADFAAAVAERFGGADMLIANAGQGYVAHYDDTPKEAWLSEANLKLFGVINPLNAFRGQLAASEIGSLTCVNSLLALQPEPHMIATSAARAALLNLTHSLAHELIDEGIRVNSILLGMVESGQWRRRFEARDDPSLSWEQWIAGIATKRGIPMKRLGRPEEPARALVFLASPLASFTTGAALDVSGGFNHHL
ncbi:SDR family oxidoreductase [Halomonas salifodinae]|uniref:SDR family oxidoreductase n=1 Tax=Halomonas salifodinae TaxID=438745 RepID=A0ABW2EY46_9GAMM